MSWLILLRLILESQSNSLKCNSFNKRQRKTIMDNQPRAQKTDFSRRQFLGGLAAATAFTIVPRHVLGGQGYQAPSDTVNIAVVGVGGMGKENLKSLETENIVALCDVDWELAKEAFEKYPNAKRYKDFRVMLEKQKEIDAVLVATPDHSHAVITMAAMQAGKHVYTQKPLTRTVSEARALTDMARTTQLITQMGNQHHSEENIRLACEWIWDGAIGAVHEVHAWSDRPVWPQGIYQRPEAMPVAEHLDWDLWLGPAPARDYNKIYHPFNWRGWLDFGTGALGDMGCHIIDYAYTALKLKYPSSVEASITMEPDPENIWTKRMNTETFPWASIVTYRFPPRGDMPAVKLIWYDGGLRPIRPEELEPGRNLPDNGLLFVGEKGKLFSNDEMVRLIPESFMKSYTLPEKHIPRIETSHEQNWIHCIKAHKTASSHFLYAGPLTETVVLGNLAVRFPYQTLEFDPEAMEIKNNTEATTLLHHQYREGWKL
jgi:predicted dehydrogenase